MKKIIYGTILIIIVLGFLFWNKDDKQAVSSGPIRIAFIGPLTGDGASWGEIEKNTIALAVKEVNDAGGIKGRPIEVTYEDGKCEGPVALSAAKKLIEVDHIKILLVSCSQEMMSIAPYANQSKVIALTSYASASDITNAGEYIFRNSYTNRDMARAMKDEALKKGKSIAIISEESAFASNLRDLFIEGVKKDGGNMISVENFQQGTRDLRTQVTKIIASKPDVVVINPNGRDTGIAALKQFRQLGYKGAFIGNFFGGSKNVQDTPEAKGMVYVSDPIFAESPLKQKVFASYEKMYGASPDIPWPVGARYDAVYILKQTFESVGDDPTAVKNYLHNMPKDFTGVLGTYRFNKDNADITNVQPAVAEIK